MGQRHQIFVRIANPIKHLRSLSPNEKRILTKELGNEETTILGFHNQWLYGRSALQNCLNLLTFAAQFDKEAKTSSKTFGGQDLPFTPNGYIYKFSTLEEIIQGISFIMNFRAKTTEWLEAGFGGSFYVKEINHDYTSGDNNDGITIIDLIENKYCFMNINGEPDPTKLRHSSRDLPFLVPVSARDYVKAYYGETIETTNDYHFRNCGDDSVKKQEVIDMNIGLNTKLVKEFEPFQLLTVAEIRAMFPNMKEVTQ